ncbi:hypothetical protein ABKN59_003876 [Abortiporus biennis]
MYRVQNSLNIYRAIHLGSRQSSRVLSTSHIIHQGWTWAAELACYKFTSLCCMKKFHHKVCWVVIPNRPTPTSLLWPYDLTLLHSRTTTHLLYR